MFAPYDKEDGLYKSFSLSLRSKEKCISDPTKQFEISFELHCEPNAIEDETFWDGPIWGGSYYHEDCARHFEHVGPLGCQTATIKGVKTLEKYTGAILLVAGLVLCFYGAAVLPWAIAFMVFFLVASFVMGIGNAMADYYSGDMTPIIGFAVVGCIAGGVAAWLFSKIYKEWAASLIACFGGFIVTIMVISMFNLPNIANLIALIVICGLCVYFGKMYDNQIKAYGTAGVGAFLIVYGIASFADKAPSLSQNSEFDSAQLMMLGGWVGLWALGAFVQHKYLSDKYGDVFSADI